MLTMTPRRACLLGLTQKQDPDIDSEKQKERDDEESRAWLAAHDPAARPVRQAA